MMKRFFLMMIAAMSALTSCSTYAQTIGPLQEENGAAYYMHTVEKGQTLYAICKLYKCDINDVVAANAGSDQSIKEGQVLRIPAAKSKINKANITTSDGNSFLIHTVEKKETLYAIAKKYDIDINRIIEANPGCDAGLKKGQELRIPIAKASEPKPADKPGNYPQHTVMSGETLYSIAKSYAVTVEAIQTVNPGLGESIKEGQVIFIPTRALPNNQSVPKQEKPKSENKPIPILGGEKKTSYDIAIMLPFYSTLPDSLMNHKDHDKDRMYRDAAVNLYRGMQMASDSLKKMGFNAEFFVEDVFDGKSAIRVAEKASIKSSDLIIGPLTKEGIDEMKKLSATSGAHIVVPIPFSNKVLLSSQNISKACASDASQWEFMGTYVAQKHKNDNVILINSIDIEDSRQVQVFSESYFAASGDSVRIVKSVNGSIGALSGLLVKGKNNIIIMPTNEKKLINALFDLMKNYDGVVYGYDEWESMEGISADNRNKYHVSFPKAIVLDYTMQSDQNWIEVYRKKFKSEPTDFSVLGYDIMMYYGQALMMYGRDFPNHFAEFNAKGLVATGFNFIKTGDESGFENRFTSVMRTEDYSIIQVK
ncbi:MAG: amino acid ABC transporter substrate-binding protein [Flavobacteriales bacterium]